MQSLKFLFLKKSFFFLEKTRKVRRENFSYETLASFELGMGSRTKDPPGPACLPPITLPPPPATASASMPPFRKEQGGEGKSLFCFFFGPGFQLLLENRSGESGGLGKGRERRKETYVLPTGAFAEKKRNSKFRNSVKRHLLCAPVKNKKL